MRDNSNASLAFKPGTDAPRGAIPVVSMRYAGVHGARRSVNVTPIGTFAVERAVRLVTSAWRAFGTLLGLICLVSITLRTPSRDYTFARETWHLCFATCNKGLGFNTT